MKNLFILSLITLLFACGSPKDDLSKKKETLNSLQKEYEKLDAQIAKLKKEIALIDTTKKVSKGILVNLKEIRPERFVHYFEVNGTVEAKEDVKISPEMGGQIKTMYIKEGDRVKEGDVLAVLNTSVLENNIAELNKALELSKTVFERQKKLWEQKIGSEMQFLEAKNKKESLEKKLNAMQSQLAMSTIKAPTSGIVDIISQKEGELAVPGLPFAQLINLSSVEIVADVSEKYVKDVRAGDTVIVSFPSLSIKEKKVPISRTGNIINPNNRTFKVRIKLHNDNETLKSNAISTLQIKDYINDSSFVVPSIIIQKDAHGEYLYTVQEDSEQWKAKKTYITSGMSHAGHTIIEKGLQANDKVIVDGYNEVSDGEIIRMK